MQEIKQSIVKRMLKTKDINKTNVNYERCES